jgi:hypothetical protein
MQLSARAKTRLLAAALLFFFLGLAAALLPGVLAELPAARRAFEERIGRELGAAAAVGSLHFHWLPRPALSAREARLDWPGGAQLQAAEIRLKFHFGAILGGRLRPAAVALRSPWIRLPLAGLEAADPAEGGRELPALLERAAARCASLPRLALAVSSGRVELLAGDGTVFGFDGVDLELRRRKQSVRFRVAAASQLGERLTAEGRIGIAPASGRMTLAANGLAPQRLAAWLDPQPAVGIADARADVALAAEWDGAGRARVQAQGRAPELVLERGGRRTRLALERFAGEIEFSGGALSLSIPVLELQVPRVHLELSLARNAGPPPEIALALKGSGDAAAARDTLLALFSDDPDVAAVFEILKGGEVPWIEARTRGATWGELADLANLEVRGRLERGRIFIPAVALDLQEVSGDARIAGGWLEGSDLAAGYRDTRGRKGSLRLGLTRAQTLLELDLWLRADLKPLPEILARLVPDGAFRRGLERLDEFSGTAEGRLKLAGDRSGPEVRVEAESFALRARLPELPAGLEARGGPLLYDGGRIQLSAVEAAVGKSRISGLNARLGLGAGWPLAADCRQALFDLGEASELLKKIPGLEFIERLEGRIATAELHLAGRADDPRSFTVKTGGRLEAVRLSSPALPQTVTLGAGRFAWEDRRLRFSGLNPTAGRSAVKGLSGDLLWDGGGRPAGSVGAEAVHLQIEEIAAWLAPLLGGFGAALEPQSLSGAVELRDARLSLSPPSPAGAGIAGFEARITRAAVASAALPHPLRVDSGAVAWRPARTELRGINAALGASRVEQLSVTIAPGGSGRIIAIGAEAAALDLGALYALVAPLPAFREARAEVTALNGQAALSAFSLQGPLDDPGRWAWRAAGTVREAAATLAALEGAVEVPAARIEVLESAAPGRTEIRLDPAVVRWGRTSLSARGTVGLGPRETAVDLALAASVLDLEALERAYRSAAGRRETASRTLTGRLRVEAGTAVYGRLASEPLKLEARIGGEETAVAFERLILCGIPVIGELRFAGGAVKGQLVPLASGGSLEKTTACISGEESLYMGTFNLDGAVDFDGPAERPLEAASGRLAFVAESGTVMRSSFFTQLLNLLSLTEIYRGAVPDFRAEGLAYNRTAADLEIRAGKLLINRWYFDGRTLWMGARGEVDLDTLTIDAVMMVSPFKTFDRIVSQIPGLRWVLGGRLVAIPLQVSGRIADPRLVPMHPAAVGTGLAEMFMRLLTLPLSIIQPFVPGLDPGESARENRSIVRE